MVVVVVVCVCVYYTLNFTLILRIDLTNDLNLCYVCM